MENNNNVQVEFFKLAKAGDNADVKLLYSDATKIAIIPTHYIPNGKNQFGRDVKKRVKCLGEKCPICQDGTYPKEDRMYLHLYDYSDGVEKVWDRTPNAKFIESLTAIDNNWGDLKTPRINIKRDSDEFPTYTVSAFPDKNSVQLDNSRYDIDVSYRCGIFRSEDELKQALATGVVPSHSKKVVANDQSNATSNTVASHTQSVNSINQTNNYAVNRVSQLVEPDRIVTEEPKFEEVQFDEDDLPF